MDATISYSESREKGEIQIEIKQDNIAVVQLKSWLTELRGPVLDQSVDSPTIIPTVIESPTIITSPPTVSVPTGSFPPAPAPKKIPFFDIGDATGKVGDRVLVPVYASCRYEMTGFHIGGGCGGYRKLKALGVKLGPMLTDYLTAQGVLSIDGAGAPVNEMFSVFQFADWDHDGALPEEWWDFALGFFSITGPQKIPGIQIPSGTLLFSVEFEILPQDVGTLELTCADNRYYTQKRHRRLDFTYNLHPQGITEIDTAGGKIEVIEG